MKFGISQSFPCSYLPDEQETLLVYAEESEHNTYYLVADYDCVGISCAAGRLVIDLVGRLCAALA